MELLSNGIIKSVRQQRVPTEPCNGLPLTLVVDDELMNIEVISAMLSVIG